MDFIRDNAIYVGLALGSAVALLWPLLFGRGASGVPVVSANEAVLLMNRSKVLILDVRDETEFANGHIQDAKNIPQAQLAERIKEIEKFKNKAILVHCQRGTRSKKACEILRQQAFTQIYDLQGGLGHWAEAKMPIVKV